MRRSIAAAALLALVSAGAAAHVVSDREVRLLRALPAGRLEALVPAAQADSLGLVGPNRTAWTHVVHQTPALAWIAAASAAGDTALALAGWRTVDAAFARQRPDGDFGRAAGIAAAEGDAATMLWAAELGRTLVVIQNGPLQKPLWKYTTPAQQKLRRTLDRLAQGAEAYRTAARGHAPRLLLQARTFLLADGIYHDPGFARIGQAALAEALALQKKDGALPAGGRTEAGPHARALESLEVLALYFPAPFLDRAADPAAAWLTSHAPAATAAPRTVALGAIVDGRDDPARRAAAALEWHRGRLALGPPPKPIPGGQPGH